MDALRDKLVQLIDDYTENLSVRDMHQNDFAEKFAGYLLANGFGLVDGREMTGINASVKLGDSVFVLYYNEDNGETEINELKVHEVSQKRIWVAGDDGYDFRVDDIGKNVFLSREDAEAYIASPEYLAERVNFVLHLNVSENAKRELLVAGFAAGQEYQEPETERYLRLTAKGPFDVWKFDVFDKNHEVMYSEAALGVRLAIDIINGEIVPAAMCKEKSVNELLSDAADRSEKSDVGRSKEQELYMN